MGHRQERWLQVGGIGQLYGAQQEEEGQRKAEKVLERTVFFSFLFLIFFIANEEMFQEGEGIYNFFSHQQVVAFIIYLNQTRVTLAELSLSPSQVCFHASWKLVAACCHSPFYTQQNGAWLLFLTSAVLDK